MPRRKLCARKRVQKLGVYFVLTSLAMSCVYASSVEGRFSLTFSTICSSLREGYGNFRKHTFIDWKGKLERSKLRPKFAVPVNDLNVHVISLQRSSQRRAACVEALSLENMSYTLSLAVDGLSPFTEGEFNRYAGWKRRALMSLTAEELSDLQEKFASSRRLSNREQRVLHERLRFGCSLSHIRIWMKLLSSTSDFFIVLEDDAIVVKEFERKTHEALKSLPDDWELFYIGYVCSALPGGYLSRNIRQLRGGSCTKGYAVSRRGAERLVFRSAVGSNLPVDNMIKVDVAAGLAPAFYADPPLLAVTDTRNLSTLAYSGG
eukprot:18909-Pelagococcus_subviridis.AAC.1